MHFLSRKTFLPVILCGFFLCLYLSHLSRSVYGGDVGDLVTASAVGGVAHPPGYPLFTLLGFFLSHSILATISPAFAVGVISSVAATLGILCFFFTLRLLTKNSLVATISSLILGFSFLYWFYAEIAEVFALNVFFALFLFYLAISYRKVKKQFIALLFFFILGLSCTHHQTIILIFPSLFLLVAKPLVVHIRKRPLSLLLFVFSFSLGLTPFLYIIIASSYNPVINWDNVHNIQSFLHLILRKDYGTFQAGLFDTPSLAQRFVTVQVYLQYLIFQITIPVLVLTIIGYIVIFKKDKILFSALFLAWFLSGPVFLFYAGFPLTSGFIIGAYERFTLLSSALFLLPFGTGLLTCSIFLAKFLPKRNYETLFQCVFLFIPIMLFIYNFPKTNLASITIGDTYAWDFLGPLPRNAVLLISGDTQIFNTWYLHYVLHKRPDVLLYNIGATPVNNNIIADSLKNVSAKNRTNALVQIIETLERQRPVFSTARFQSKTAAKITWIPYGLVYQMYQPFDTLPSKDAYEKTTDTVWSMLHTPTTKSLSNPVNHSLTVAEIPTDYSNSLIATGTFIYSQYHDTQKTQALYNQALAISPDNDKAYSALGILYMAMPGKCNAAVSYLSQSLSLNSYEPLSYFLLYNEYLNCFKDKKSAEGIVKIYEGIFGKNFQEQLQKSKDSLSL